MPRTLIGLFTRDEAVLALGCRLLLVAAVFQLFDGVQGVTTGVLRGGGHSHTDDHQPRGALAVRLLPVGYALCFVFGMGVIGLWIGLSTGLIIAGAVLLYAWHRQIRNLQITPRAA